MSRKAIIDIGSNSIKFMVCDRAEDGTVLPVLDTNDIARLGEGLDKTGEISPEAMERNVAAVAAFAAKAKELGAEEIAAVGTMALRKAANSGEFIAKVQDACGVTVQIIPGEEEARLSYLAVLSALPLGDAELVIFDTGGGSTEFIYGKGTELKNRFSVNLGAVRITENFLAESPLSEEQVAAARAQIDSEFAAAGVTGAPKLVVGMGGTVTSMGAVKHKMVKYDPDVIQGSTLTRADIAEQIEAYRTRTFEQRKELPGLQPKRADVILAGALILDVITDRLGVDGLTISDRGLRHGLAFDLFSR
ncbi:MAG: Ppx/GppA family phosphatase [Clostridia bacterium]|nr:Ppx/GppA family phosphatase [Clostridia bacterium]